MYLILSDVLKEWTLTSTAINTAYHILVEENFSRCDTSYCKWPPWSSLNVGWLRETDGPRDTHCHLLSRSGQLSRSHGGNMTFIARFVHIKQVGGKSNQKYAISDTGGTQDGNGSNWGEPLKILSKVWSLSTDFALEIDTLGIRFFANKASKLRSYIAFVFGAPLSDSKYFPCFILGS